MQYEVTYIKHKGEFWCYCARRYNEQQVALCDSAIVCHLGTTKAKTMREAFRKVLRRVRKYGLTYRPRGRASLTTAELQKLPSGPVWPYCKVIGTFAVTDEDDSWLRPISCTPPRRQRYNRSAVHEFERKVEL